MSDSLEDWIILQQHNIAKTQAVLELAFQLCNNDAHKIDTSSLELLVSNAIMHIDAICQYAKCIETLMQARTDIPESITKLHVLNTHALHSVEQKYACLQTLATSKMQDLHYKVGRTSEFIAQLM